MGWFSFGSSSGPKSEKASDGGRIAPNRSSREVCYNGRDLFFSCLDRNDILDAVKNDSEARKKCGKEIAEFESACSKAWVRFVLSRFYYFCLFNYYLSPVSLTLILFYHIGQIFQREASYGIQQGPDDR